MDLMSLIRPRSAVLRTSLSPDEVAAKLAGLTDSSLTFFGSKPLIGSVSPVSLSLRKRIGYRNSWQTVMSATLEGQKGQKGQKGQTTIRCRFWMHLFVVVFMAVWFTLAIGGVFGVLGTLADGGFPEGTPGWVAVIPLGLFAFGWLMLAVGRWMARHEESYLVETLRTALGATVVERDPGFETLDAAAMERQTSSGVRPIVVLVAAAVLLLAGLAGAMIYFTSAPS